MSSETVNYFAFGSNLFAERLCQGSCPSVSYPKSFVSIGEAKNWEITFGDTGGSLWKGASATIKKRDNSSVFGAIWRIQKRELKTLDRQEGVNRGVYKRVKSPEDILITDNTGAHVDCYTYIMNEKAKSSKPSPQYKHVIVSGAKEISLPKEYIQNVLEKVDDNGNNSPVSIKLSILPNGNIPQ